MPVLERPEIIPFLKIWRNKPPEQAEQVAEEMASYSLETNGTPDPYEFFISPDGELLSPTAHCRVKDVVQRTHPVGELEYRALLSIEQSVAQWIKNNDKGVIAWISPRSPGLYPTSRVIISEIEQKDGKKTLFNRKLVLDFDETRCLGFARDLARFSQNQPLFSHLEQVRATPLVLNTRGRSWIYILEELIDDPILWESIRNGEDQRAKKEAVRQARMVQKDLFAVSRPSDEVPVAFLQMLGTKGASCPVNMQKGTAFQIFSESAITFVGSISKDPDFCRVCPVCQREINCIVRVGGSCPACGTVKRCG